jgi:hypothetical protein
MASINEVRVYMDPYTMQRFEGSAKVLKIYFCNGTHSHCKVHFLSGPKPRTLNRWVDNEQLKTAGLPIPCERVKQNGNPSQNR